MHFKVLPYRFSCITKYFSLKDNKEKVRSRQKAERSSPCTDGNSLRKNLTGPGKVLDPPARLELVCGPSPPGLGGTFCYQHPQPVPEPSPKMAIATPRKELLAGNVGAAVA